MLAAGLLGFALAARSIYRLGRYRFENTTDGGVVQFRSYGAAMRHDLKGQVSGLVLLVSTLVAFAGAVMLLSSF